MCNLHLKVACGINWAEINVNPVGKLQGLYSVKVEGRVQPRTGHEGSEEQ
jgi:hypothetical protein